jgi:hypothetical protein
MSDMKNITYKIRNASDHREIGYRVGEMGQGITTGVRQPGEKITEDWIRTASLQCIERYTF